METGTYNDSRVYYILANRICWINALSLKQSKILTPDGYLIHEILPIALGKIVVNGAKKVEKGFQEHVMLLVTDGEFLELPRHDFGIIGVQLVFSKESLYAISDKKCQIYSFHTDTYKNIEDMKSIHIDPGCCIFNDKLYVIGGVNNYEVEAFDPKTRRWSKFGVIDQILFKVKCIQINNEEILIISHQQYYKFNTVVGEITFKDWLPVRAKSHKIGHPVVYCGYVFCIIGNTRLLRYNIGQDKWDILNQNTGCCFIM